MNPKESSDPQLPVPISPRRFSRSASVTCIIAVMLAFGMVLHTSTVHAGTNGQQLQVTCSQATSIVVIGVNQNGTETTQAFYPDTSGSSTFTTSGWWWVGNVAILWYGPGGSGRFYDSVPQQQDGDVYATDCNNPTMQYDFPTIDGAMCDSATATAEQEVTCLGNAPVYPCSAVQQPQPCIPYLDSAYITTTQWNLSCLMNGISTDLNLDDPANLEANQLSSPYPVPANTGSATLYWRVWGISYRDASGWSVAQQWYKGVTDLVTLTPGTVPGPYYITGSMGAGFTCNSMN